MTQEARLARLERIAKLFVNAGLRARSHMRELDGKFEMLVNMQMENTERFRRNELRFARNEERFARNEERFARNEEKSARVEEKLAKLSEKTDRRFLEMSEAHTVMDRKLTELIQFLRQRENGNGKRIDN